MTISEWDCEWKSELANVSVSGSVSEWIKWVSEWVSYSVNESLSDVNVHECMGPWVSQGTSERVSHINETVRVSERGSQRMCPWANQWVGQGISESAGHSESADGWVGKQISVWAREWVSKGGSRFNEAISEWTCVNKRMSRSSQRDWVRESAVDQVSEWVSQRGSQGVSQCVSELVSEWFESVSESGPNSRNPWWINVVWLLPAWDDPKHGALRRKLRPLYNLYHVALVLSPRRSRVSVSRLKDLIHLWLTVWGFTAGLMCISSGSM